MKYFAVLAFAATALAQVAPPSGCVSTAQGTFSITTVNVTTASRKRDLSPRQLSGVLTMSLKDSMLTDQAGRTGYIASNYQFQFNSPVQGNAVTSKGFSLCANDTLAHDSSAIWYQCLSGDFYNIYSQSIGGQCVPVYIQAVMQSGGGVASQISDGQPQVTGPPVVSQISDGQPQATAIVTGLPVISQISDGQPQVTGAPIVSQISDGQPQVTGPPVISQISDGQPQVTGPPVISQISDGQPQVTFSPVYNATKPTYTGLPEFTGAAVPAHSAHGALFAGVLALLAML